MRRSSLALACVLLGGLAGCAGAPAGPPGITVEAAGQQIPLQPTQYCLDDEVERYDVVPPIINVPPDTVIGLEVPGDVAERGWSVQVYDDQLETRIGDVDIDAGTEVFDEINSSDVAPAAFYLVVVEDRSSDCDGLSGAWPVGFIRADG